MKTWFNGDSEGKIKRGTSHRKGTLSDELSKADLIEKQLRYNESELKKFKEQEPKLQGVKSTVDKVDAIKDKYRDEETTSKRSSIQMSSPFPPRRQTVEEASDKGEQLVEMSIGVAPFPPRRQAEEELTNEVTKSVEEISSTVEEIVGIPVGVAPFSPRIQLEETTHENTPWKPQQVTLEHKIQYGNKEELQCSKNKQILLASARELAKEIVKTAPEKMEIEIPSPFSPSTYDAPKPVKNFNLSSAAALDEMAEYNYSDNYSRQDEEGYKEDYEVERHHNLGFVDTKEINKVEAERSQSIQEENKIIDFKPSINLKANITLSFDKEHTMNLNTNIGSVIMILNNSGEKFDFKITNDGEGGQNLNIVAPSHTIYQILALFE